MQMLNDECENNEKNNRQFKAPEQKILRRKKLRGHEIYNRSLVEGVCVSIIRIHTS